MIRPATLTRVGLGTLGAILVSPAGLALMLRASRSHGSSALAVIVLAQLLGLAGLAWAFRSHALAALAGAAMSTLYLGWYLFYPGGRDWASFCFLEQIAVVTAYGVFSATRPGRRELRVAAVVAPLVLVGIVLLCRRWVG